MNLPKRKHKKREHQDPLIRILKMRMIEADKGEQDKELTDKVECHAAEIETEEVVIKDVNW